MKNHKNVDVFFALIRAGLWEQSVRLLPFEPIDFEALYQLADDQSVVGLVAAGLEHVVDRKVTKPEAVSFLKKVFSLESRNVSMNAFIEKKVLEMRRRGIYALLVKGQGIAQCYERPEWRSSGDIDFFFDEENYAKAKSFYSKEAEISEPEGVFNKHLAMTVDSWTVELHGTLRRMTNKKETFIVKVEYSQNRSWQGLVIWAEEGRQVRFRSALELLKLMDEAMSVQMISGIDRETSLG